MKDFSNQGLLLGDLNMESHKKQKIQKPFYMNKRFLLLLSVLVIFVLNAVIVDLAIYSSPEEIKDPDQITKENDKIKDKEKTTDPEKTEDQEKEDDKEPPTQISVPDESELMSKVELIGIVVDGRHVGQVYEEKQGVEIKPGNNYGIIKTDDKITSVTIGDMILKDWEVIDITEDYIDVISGDKEVRLGFYK